MAKNKGKFRSVEAESFDCCAPGRRFRKTISFDEKELPEIKKWEVGKEYQITLKVVQQSERKEEDRPREATFGVIAVKADSKLNNKQQTILDKMSS